MSKSTFRNSSKTYFFNACFDKNQLKNLISWFIKQSGEKITVDFLETIKQIGFHQATQAGVSLGLDDLQIPSQKGFFISQAKADVSLFEQQSRSGNVTSVEKSQQMISTWNQTSDILRKTAVQHFKNTNPVNPVYMMAFSGARGNISQVRQLVAMRGLMADPQGVILEFPIQSNFREGLTLTEYLISCYGARKGLVDTALRTATSGYLTRRLVDAAQHVIVSTKDCGTTQGFRLRNKDLEQHLIGRVLSKDLIINQTCELKRNQKISPRLAKLISKSVKQVFVRSPLTCQAENSICQLCYGWNLAHGTLVSIGEAVGVIAAQSIGEPGTQLTMRTFHTGGVGVFSDQAMKYFLAPYDGIIEYTRVLPGHFVRTPHGKIVYMLKNNTESSQNRILKLKSTNATTSVLDPGETYYSLKQQDLPAGSILLVRQGERVKTGQVLAQSSQIKKSKQKMPESAHPVFSTMDGEIYLESMMILKQKQLPPKPKKTKKTQKKQNEIGPDIRTLKGLGAFWVFSSENKQEFHSAKTILRPGDLVSLKSSLFQYDFYVNNRTIFHTLLNKSCLGVNMVSLPIENINFHKVAYSMIVKNSSNFSKQNQTNQKDFLFFNKKRLQNFLIWCPTESILADSGYFFNFLLYSELKNKTTRPFNLFSFAFLQSKNTREKKSQTKNSQNFSLFSSKCKKIVTNNWFTGSFYYLPTKIEKYNITFPFYFKNILITDFLNLKNQNNLKKHVFLQYHLKNSTNLYLEAGTFLESKKAHALVSPSENRKNIKIKTKFLYRKQRNYIIESMSTRHNDFLKIALNRVKNSSLSKVDFSSRYFQQNTGWIYIPNAKTSALNTHVLTPVGPNAKALATSVAKFLMWEQGKIFDNFIFLNSKISIKSIPSNQIGLMKSLKNKKLNPYSKTMWYSQDSLLTNNSFLLIQQSKNKYITKASATSVYEKDSSKKSKNYSKSFLYYKLQKVHFSNANAFTNVNVVQKATLFETESATSVPLKTTNSIIKITKPVVRKTKQGYQNKTTCFLLVSLLNEFSLPKKPEVIKRWNGMKKLDTRFLTNSPLFTKQESTFFQKNQKIRKKFQLVLSGSQASARKGWFCSKNIFKILINLNSPVFFKKVNQSYLLANYIKNHKIPIIGFNLFLYNYILLPENVSFYFEFFENKWVIPNKKITTGFIRITKDGEFRRFQSKKNKSVVSILTPQNLLTLDFSKFLSIPNANALAASALYVNPSVTSIPNAFTNVNVVQKATLFESESASIGPNNTKNLQKNKQVQTQIGTILRSGTEIFPGITSSNGGLILNKNFTQFTLRLGIPFLASARGIIHVFQNDLIQKNDLLVTLKSRRLQTEDIVQGIPKIEQLFEARETQGGTIIRNSVHTRLKKYFLSCLKSEKVVDNALHSHLSKAVTDSLNKIQFFLVQSILQAYSSQGVKLSQKHIEIIVRQMTTRVRILAGGDSGLLPGELIQFTKIQKLNDQLYSLGKRPAIYEPLILGITKSVLQSESFLLSASFQEVSRVLVRSALTKKTDFLRGLHENVILGQLVPTGTGLVSNNTKIIKK